MKNGFYYNICHTFHVCCSKNYTGAIGKKIEYASELEHYFLSKDTRMGTGEEVVFEIYGIKVDATSLKKSTYI